MKKLILTITAVLLLGSWNNLFAECKAVNGKVIVPTNCKTITEGIAAIKDGGTVTVLLGTYKESISIPSNVKVIGEVTKNEKGEITQRPIISSLNKIIVEIKGNEITFENFEITNDDNLTDDNDFVIMSAEEKKGDKYGRTGIRVKAGSSMILISHNKFNRIGYKYEGNVWQGEQAYAINVKSYNEYDKKGNLIVKNEPISNIQIIGNELNNLHLGQSEAITLNGKINDFIISNNTISKVDNIAIDIGGFQENDRADDENGKPQGKPQDFQASNGQIIGNNISYLTDGNPGQTVNDTYPFEAGIYIDGGKDVRIFGNQLFRFGIGISVGSEKVGKSVSNINISNNSIYENKVAGIQVGKDSEFSSFVTDCIVENNTIRDNGNEVDGGQIRLESYLYKALQKIEIRNNLILITVPQKMLRLLYVENCIWKDKKCNPSAKLIGVNFNNNYFLAINHKEAWKYNDFEEIPNTIIGNYFEKDMFLYNKIGTTSFVK